MADGDEEALTTDLASFAEGDFWSFSLAIYARPGVRPACLRLQDELGLDVNMVLFCLWAGSRGRRLEQDRLAAIAAEAKLWQHHAVAPLRQLRRWLKAEAAQGDGKVAQLRRAIKEQELRAEAIEQTRLSRQLPDGQGASDAAAAAQDNFKTYLRLENVALTYDINDIFSNMLKYIVE